MLTWPVCLAYMLLFAGSMSFHVSIHANVKFIMMLAAWLIMLACSIWHTHRLTLASSMWRTFRIHATITWMLTSTACVAYIRLAYVLKLATVSLPYLTSMLAFTSSMWLHAVLACSVWHHRVTRIEHKDQISLSVFLSPRLCLRVSNGTAN